MNNKLAKRLRRQAELVTTGKPDHVTRSVYQRNKADYKLAKRLGFNPIVPNVKTMITDEETTD